VARENGELEVKHSDLGPTNEDVLEAAKSGNRQALEELIRTHYPCVFGYLLRLSGDYHVAEDLTQDVFYKAWLQLGTFRGRAPFRAWLYRIAHNAYVDRTKSWHQRKIRVAGTRAEGGDLSLAVQIGRAHV